MSRPYYRDGLPIELRALRVLERSEKKIGHVDLQLFFGQRRRTIQRDEIATFVGRVIEFHPAPSYPSLSREEKRVLWDEELAAVVPQLSLKQRIIGALRRSAVLDFIFF